MHRINRPLFVVAALLLAAACTGGAPAGPATAPAPPNATRSSVASPKIAPRPTPEPAQRPNDDIVASTAAIPIEELPLVEFTDSSGRVVTLAIEVLPRPEFPVGLSGRYHLEERGMLFYYGEAVRNGFWMKNTHIDLSIAFIDGDGRIVDIREMEAESLDIVLAASVYHMAIEAPAGWYASNGLAVGDRARLDFEASAALAGGG